MYRTAKRTASDYIRMSIFGLATSTGGATFATLSERASHGASGFGLSQFVTRLPDGFAQMTMGVVHTVTHVVGLA